MGSHGSEYPDLGSFRTGVNKLNLLKSETRSGGALPPSVRGKQLIDHSGNTVGLMDGFHDPARLLAVPDIEHIGTLFLSQGFGELIVRDPSQSRQKRVSG